MKRRTAFEKMRRNRMVLEQAAAGLAVERELEQERERFLDERNESFDDTRDWLEDTRRHTRRVVPPDHVIHQPQPSRIAIALAMLASLLRVRRAA